eukprot:Gb_15784 [translate_table: standard]
MGSKWKKARNALGLHLCALVPPDLTETPSHETVSCRSSASDAALLGGAPESTAASLQIAPTTPGRSPSRLHLIRPSIKLSRVQSTCAICLEAIKPGHGHALFTAECSHTFHFPCIASNVKHGNLICPVCRAKWNEVPLLVPPAIQAPPGRRRRLNASNWTQETGWTRDLPRLQSPRPSLHEFVPRASAREPSVFDDDEPLVVAQTSPCDIRQNKSHEQDINAFNADEGDMADVNCEYIAKHEENVRLYSPTGAKRAIGRKEDSKILHLETFPELAAIPRADAWDKFTVLVHLKAPSSSTIHLCERVQAGAREEDSGLQHATDLPENMVRSPFAVPDLSGDRAPIDLVTVLDVSGSMAGTKLALLKRAMGFVIQNLSPADRLSVVVFSSTARRLFPLRRMVEEGRQQALQAVDLLVSTGGTNIVEGLRKGAKVLEDRREHNPVSSIMLLSDGQDTYNIGNRWEATISNSRRVSDYHCLLPGSIRHASQHGLAQVLVHTFGFGSDHDSAAMHSIAEASGGTFSFIETESVIQDAFAQCIGGLLSVMIQDVQVVISSANPEVQLSAIHAGSYVGNIIDNAQQGLVKIGDLYAEEERDFLLELKLPAISTAINCSNSNDMKVIKVFCIYRDPVSQETIQTTVNELCIERPESVSIEQQAVCLEVDRQRNRLCTANSIAEARAFADRGDLSRAQLILGTRRAAVQGSPAAQAGDQLCRALESELTEIQERMANMQLYENSGRAYVLSAHSSHSRQRATTRGYSSDSISMGCDYKTSKMVDMLMRSQTMCPPPHDAHSRSLLPSRSFPLPEARSSRP